MTNEEMIGEARRDAKFMLNVADVERWGCNDLGRTLAQGVIRLADALERAVADQLATVVLLNQDTRIMDAMREDLSDAGVRAERAEKVMAAAREAQTWAGELRASRCTYTVTLAHWAETLDDALRAYDGGAE